MAGLMDGFPLEAPAPQVSKKAMFFAKLRDIGDAGQGGPANSQATLRQKAQAQQQAALLRQQAMAAAQQLFPDNKQLQFIAAAKPEAFFSTLQEYSKPQKLAQGEQLATMGGPQGAYNPKTGFEGDVPYKLDQNGQATYGTARPKTYVETETEANNLRTDANADAGLQEQIRAHNEQYEIGRGNLGVSRGNLDLSRQRLNGSGGGGLEGMSTEQLIALAKGLK